MPIFILAISGRGLEAEPAALLPGGLAEHGQRARGSGRDLHHLPLLPARTRLPRRRGGAAEDQLQPQRSPIGGKATVDCYE